MITFAERSWTVATVLLFAGLVGAPAASSQGIAFSVGPQVSTLGVGLSATARITDKLGVSAEFNLYPIESIDKTGFDNTVTIEPTLQGGQLMVTFHPSGGKFALGAGLLAGGFTADASLILDPASNATIELGNGEYPASGVGNLTGKFEFGTVQPTFMLGWIGKGFNFALGAAIATPKLELDASGPLGSDSAFRADLDREIADFDDTLGSVPVFPYVRLGWQFGF